MSSMSIYIYIIWGRYSVKWRRGPHWTTSSPESVRLINRPDDWGFSRNQSKVIPENARWLILKPGEIKIGNWVHKWWKISAAKLWLVRQHRDSQNKDSVIITRPRYLPMVKGFPWYWDLWPPNQSWTINSLSGMYQSHAEVLVATWTTS